MAVTTSLATSALAAPMVNASLVVRNDALAWGQRLDTLLPAVAPPHQRTLAAQEAARPAATSVVTSASAALTGVPVMSRPITGVVVMPASPVPVQTKASATGPATGPVAMAAPAPAPAPQETGWMRSFQSWILGVARAIGQ